MTQDISAKLHYDDQVPLPRRRYNQWVANETLEDFALRHTARRARRWSFFRIANTALGTSAFLVLELLGATIAINYGVYHSLWAIAVVCSLLFLSGIPISYYAAKYSVDIDLLTRGAGFGYIGSTISSLIYASFTFIFFALEAAIMARALELLMGVPLWAGYIISALIVIPLVTHGISRISRFQLLTQPLWILLQIIPFIYVITHSEGWFTQWSSYAGEHSANKYNESGNTFNAISFGAATTVLFALVAQIGEQVDFLRFLPEPEKKERKKWWAAVILAGPGWIFLGSLKLILGTILGYLLISQGLDANKASDPTQMYAMSFSQITQSPQLALIFAAIFVIICQLKINVANAYAGSLAWSNFFSRLTHHHPGRVVWVVFNVLIALMLMELGVYRAIETVLHHYSAFVLAWFGSIVADLIICKPLKLSPKHIEFKRSKLYDINPVGVCSTVLAAALGLMASTALLGPLAESFSGFIAFFFPFLTVPLFAFWTKGKYYLVDSNAENKPILTDIPKATVSSLVCTVCQNDFDVEDMSQCPAYAGNICSLCCALETRCKDQCRPKAHISAQIENFAKPFFKPKLYTLFIGPLGQFFLIFLILSSITLGIFFLSYFPFSSDTESKSILLNALGTSYFLLLIILGVIVWLFVLAQNSTRMALEETNSQTQRLTDEMKAHKITFEQLERARKSADSANIAKSNYVAALSHELRTPLNVILGYAQLLQKDSSMFDEHKEKISILRRNGEHLSTMIEGLLEISKIEAGKLALNVDHVRLDLMLDQLIIMFRQQAQAKGLTFYYDIPPNLPKSIKVDEKRLRQILINLLSNAIKFTERGSVTFSVKYRGHVARFCVSDTGFGISANKLHSIFLPFERGENAEIHNIPGSGLGLAICRQLTDMMGADIEISSEIGKGSTFTLLLQASPTKPEITLHKTDTPIIGYEGERKTILVIDDNDDHRRLLKDLLTPLTFNVIEAADFDNSHVSENTVFDLVLLDVRLGNKSGWEVAKKIKKHFPRVAIIMVSANARGFYDNMPSERIHDDYIEKAIQLDVLLEKIGNLIHLRWVYAEQKDIDIHADNKLSDAGTQAEVLPSDAPAEYSKTSNLQWTNNEFIDALTRSAKIGHLNEFLYLLDDRNACKTLSEDNIEKLRVLANQYRFEDIVNILNEHGDSYP